ncbi:FHA domain-containing protein [Oscillochloris trichoides DG-6]|uniref:FHA domain-containing protein n=1 Tax=Oscillochloris trichoides DG-6 TaxID=765420 RepID=E1ICI2_9CHLR|nr:FHA domain-containing protein [Oscillochloris trichoides DG-6]
MILLTLALTACGTTPQASLPTVAPIPTATASPLPPTAVPTETAVPPPPPTAAPTQTTIPTPPPPPAPTQPPQRPLPTDLPRITPPAPATVGEVPADLLNTLIADAAQRSGVDAAAITLLRGAAVEWNDSALGCPQPDMAYLQVITPGYQVILQAGQQTYDYHTDTRGYFILCTR